MDKLAELVKASKVPDLDLNSLNADEAKIQAFVGALLAKGGAGELAELVINNRLSVDNFPELSADQAKQLAEALLAKGDEGGVDKLAELVKAGKVPDLDLNNLNADEAKIQAFVGAVLKAGGEGELAGLLIGNKMPDLGLKSLTPAQSKQLAEALFAKSDEGGVDKLAELVKGDKVKLDAAQVPAFAGALLAKGDEGGVDKLAELVIADKVKLDAAQVPAFAEALLAKGDEGAGKLAELVINNRLSVENFPTLTPDQATQ
ncbi:MAG: hypothetical protein LBI47_01165, partial [Puniceicoccales bacterium]|nr:hypothetical protein [Puniceicoccales bacterium]